MASATESRVVPITIHQTDESSTQSQAGRDKKYDVFGTFSKKKLC